MVPSAVTWSSLLARLSASRSYWLNTTGSDGSPHAAPVWGASVQDTLVLYTERLSVKARNLARDPRAIIHLESAEDVVIVHALLEDVGHPTQSLDVMAALDRKYTRAPDAQYLPSNNQDFDVVYAVRPRRVLAWRLDDYEGSQQRWHA